MDAEEPERLSPKSAVWRLFTDRFLCRRKVSIADRENANGCSQWSSHTERKNHSCCHGKLNYVLEEMGGARAEREWHCKSARLFSNVWMDCIQELLAERSQHPKAGKRCWPSRGRFWTSKGTDWHRTEDWVPSNMDRTFPNSKSQTYQMSANSSPKMHLPDEVPASKDLNMPQLKAAADQSYSRIRSEGCSMPIHTCRARMVFARPWTAFSTDWSCWELQNSSKLGSMLFPGKHHFSWIWWRQAGKLGVKEAGILSLKQHLPRRYPDMGR